MSGKCEVGRLDFLKLSACAAAAAAWTWDGLAGTAGEEIVRHDAPPRNRRPYAGVDWANAFQIRTTSHGHCDNQKMLDAYMKRGFELLTISNYYPSAPRYPLKDVRENSFRLHHDFPVMVKGKRVEGPFDWNKIVVGWAMWRELCQMPSSFRKGIMASKYPSAAATGERWPS